MTTRLREYRKKAGMSQSELALILKVSQRYIAFLENGQRTPSLNLAKKISDYFNAPIEDIFLLNESTKSTQNKKEA